MCTERKREREREVLLRFAKNADRGVIIYIRGAARTPGYMSTRRHAAALPADDMNLIYKL